VNKLGQSVLAAMQRTIPESNSGARRSWGHRWPGTRREGRARDTVHLPAHPRYVAFRFQWKLGVGAIVAALHDPIIILGSSPPPA